MAKKKVKGTTVLVNKVTKEQIVFNDEDVKEALASKKFVKKSR